MQKQASDNSSRYERRSISLPQEILAKIEARQGNEAFSTHLQAEIDRLGTLTDHLMREIGPKLSPGDVETIINVISTTPWENSALNELIELLPEKLLLAYRYGRFPSITETSMEDICEKLRQFSFVERFAVLDFIGIYGRFDSRKRPRIKAIFTG